MSDIIVPQPSIFLTADVIVPGLLFGRLKNPIGPLVYVL